MVAHDLTRYRAELFLMFSSIYAAAQLLIFHQHFSVEPGRYALLIHLENNENFWAWLVTLSAMSKLVGLAISFLGQASFRVSLYLRRAGLVGSAVFWTILGLSYLIQFPYNVVSGPMIFMGGLSFWLLIQMPVDGYS